MLEFNVIFKFLIMVKLKQIKNIQQIKKKLIFKDEELSIILSIIYHQFQIQDSIHLKFACLEIIALIGHH